MRAWERRELGDRLYAAAHRRRLEVLVDEARRAIESFLAAGRAYVSVSWGKDSVVLAHVARDHGLPLLWVRVDPIANPDCALVRDAFLRHWPAWPAEYHEEVVTLPRPTDGEWHASGSLDRGFRAAASALHAHRYILGIRGAESSARAARIARGLSITDSCAPLGHWSSDDIFAYSALHDLPIHPAYACSFDGELARDWIRTASLGGRSGDGVGRAEWERRYYGQELDALDRAAQSD